LKDRHTETNKQRQGNRDK